MFNLPKKLIGEDVVVAFKTIVPTKNGPDFMQMQMNLVSQDEDSITTAITMQDSSISTMHIPKDVINYVASVSRIKAPPSGVIVASR